MDAEFDKMIEDAAPYASISSILKESIGGKLDFKLKLSEEKLYLMNGVVYNRNEAGNFIWAYFLKMHNYLEILGGVLAQAGSIISKNPRFDEAHDRAARYAGLKFWYQIRNRAWQFRLKYGYLDRP